MTRAEAERLLLLADRVMQRGLPAGPRRKRLAEALDLAEAEIGFADAKAAQPSLFAVEGGGSEALLDQSARARRSDPETSRQAAASLSGALRLRQKAVLQLLREASGTDEQLAIRYREAIRQGRLIGGELFPSQSPSGLRTRRHELVEAGLAFDSGERRRISTGGTAIVWKAREGVRGNGGEGDRAA